MEAENHFLSDFGEQEAIWRVSKLEAWNETLVEKINNYLFFLRLKESNSLVSPPRFQAYRRKDPVLSTLKIEQGDNLIPDLHTNIA